MSFFTILKFAITTEIRQLKQKLKLKDCLVTLQTLFDFFKIIVQHHYHNIVKSQKC